MKKLIFGIMVAMMAMTFSAFTAKKSVFPDVLFYLGSDGNYHRLTTPYDPSKCLPSPGSTCTWIWNDQNSDPGVNVIDPGLFGVYIEMEDFIPYGSPNRRYNTR